MGRDITWPAGDWDAVYSNTEVSLTHKCYTSYRGYGSAEKQLGKRFVVDANGKMKKGFHKWTMLEGEAYAPTDYITYRTVVLEPGDFIIASLRTCNEKQRVLVELLVFEVTEDLLKNLKLGNTLSICPKLEIEINKINNFWSNVPDSEWIHQIPEVLHKAVRKAFKIPKRVLKNEN